MYSNNFASELVLFIIGALIICLICACVSWCCRFFCPINEGAAVLSRPDPNDIYPVNANQMYPPNPTTYPGTNMATDNGNSGMTYPNMYPTISGVNPYTIYPENPNTVYHPNPTTNPAESATPVYKAYPMPYHNINQNMTHFEFNPDPSSHENPNPVCPPIPPYPKAHLNPGYGFSPSICPNLSPNSVIENPNPTRQCVNPTASMASVDV